MKVLLDECVDVDLRKRIAGHDVFTVTYMRWNGLKNGELLARAVQQQFEAFVTTDRSVPYEQHLVSLPIRVLILRSAANDIDELVPLIPLLLAALNHVRPGTVTEIGAP